MTEDEHVQLEIWSQKIQKRIDKVENVLTALLFEWSRSEDSGPTLAQMRTLLNKILEDSVP